MQCKYAEAIKADRKVLLAQHHPLYTAGKRAYERDFHNDLGRYLDKRKLPMVQHFLGIKNACEETPFNLCLTECYRRQNMIFDMVLAAHDHHIYNYNNKHNGFDDYKLCQLVVGSGGGDLQDRNKFDDQALMGCFLKQIGVANVTHHHGDEHFNFSVHTSDRKHDLVFNTHQPRALVAWDNHNPEHDEMQTFFEVVESAISQYISFLGDRQNTYKGNFFSLTNNTTHGNDGAARAHQLWAYINHHQPQKMTVATHVVYEMTKRGWFERSASENSLITLLNDAMIKKYKMTMETFATAISRRSVIGFK